MLTIAKLKRWSINYYNDTARAAGQAATDLARAGGGLGEYYSERDTRTPVWMWPATPARSPTLVGLDRCGACRWAGRSGGGGALAR